MNIIDIRSILNDAEVVDQMEEFTESHQSLGK
jgi:hypothetical protein